MKIKSLYIKDPAIILITTFTLDFVGGYLGAKGWIYQEIDTGTLKIISILTFCLSLGLFISFTKYFFSKKTDKMRQITERVILLIIYVFQCFAMIGIHVNILLLSINFI